MKAESIFLAAVPLSPLVMMLSLYVFDSPWSEVTQQTIFSQLGGAILASLVGFLFTAAIMPAIAKRMPQSLTGKDLCKKGLKGGDIVVPESQGIVSGTIFMIIVIMLQALYADTYEQIAMYNAGLLSICFMLYLGFVDDVLDLPWRYKLVLPPIAALPLLVTYHGLTSVVLPKPLRFLFRPDGLLHAPAEWVFDVDDNSDGAVLDLGIFYKVYMLLLSVFCTNSINIYAGVNGLEAGQAFVIGCAVVTQNMIEIFRGHDGNKYHSFSLMLMLPFLGTSLGLLKHNWYPSSVFVGDTFCYYAGVTFAVVGILGHFSKTLLLFFLPQILNFLYSVPQLFHLVPCPRHRLPRLDPRSGLLQCSLIPGSSHHNLTLINLALSLFGPMKERNLVILLLAFQILCCSAALLIRYHLAGYFYDHVD